MARIVIQDSSTGEIKQISDRVLPFFPGWVQVDTIDDEFPPTLFYTGAAADARYVNVAEISDPDSPGGVALRAALEARAPVVSSITRDATGRIVSLTQDGVTESYTRDATGRVATLTVGDVTRTVTRDATGRIQAVA